PGPSPWCSTSRPSRAPGRWPTRCGAPTPSGSPPGRARGAGPPASAPRTTARRRRRPSPPGPPAPPPTPRPHCRARPAPTPAAGPALRAPGLAWTIVRPGSLTDAPGPGRVRLADRLDGWGRVPRDAVAAVLAAVLVDGLLVRRTVELVAGDTPIAEALAALEADG